MNKKVFHNRPFSPQEAQIRRLISSRMVSPKSMSQNENPEETDLFEKIKVYYKDHKIRKIKRNSIERENRPTSKVFNANKNKFVITLYSKFRYTINNKIILLIHIIEFWHLLNLSFYLNFIKILDKSWRE